MIQPRNVADGGGVGGGNQDPRTFENREVRPPISFDISVFFLEIWVPMKFGFGCL